MSKKYTLREAVEIGRVLGNLQGVVSSFEISHRGANPVDEIDAFNRLRLANELKQILADYRELCIEYPVIADTTPPALISKIATAEKRFDQEYSFW